MKIYRFNDFDDNKHYRYEVIKENTIHIHDLITGQLLYILNENNDIVFTSSLEQSVLHEYNKEYISWSEVYDLLFDDQWVGTADLIPMTLAMLQESSEALNELNWKPWKTTEVNLEAYKEELADVFIFLMVCAKIAGMSADDLISQTFVKHNYNKVRKDHDRNKDK